MLLIIGHWRKDLIVLYLKRGLILLKHNTGYNEMRGYRKINFEELCGVFYLRYLKASWCKINALF